MKKKTHSSKRDNPREDEPNESRIFAQRGADVEFDETPSADGPQLEERDLLEDVSIGREQPNNVATPATADDRSAVFGHGFGIGTVGGLEGEHEVETGHDSGIRRKPKSGGGPVSTGM